MACKLLVPFPSQSVVLFPNPQRRVASCLWPVKQPPPTLQLASWPCNPPLPTVILLLTQETCSHSVTLADTKSIINDRGDTSIHPLPFIVRLILYNGAYVS